MKCLVVLAVLAVAVSAGKWQEGFNVRFDTGDGAGRSFFIPIPYTLREALNARWVESPRPPGQPRPGLALLNPSRDDVVLGILYDGQGNAAGLQIAIPQDKFLDFPYDWEIQGYTEWVAPADSLGQVRKYHTTAVYFVSDATLAKSPEERAASRKGRILQEDFIYLTSFNGELLPIPTKASLIASETDYKRQNCIPGMGRHYFYNMTQTSPLCETDSFFPWFTLVDEDPEADQLLGMGLIAIGKLPEADLNRDYFERPDAMVTRAIAPFGPQCLYDSVARYGLVTMHIYFVENPLLIGCTNT